MTQQRVRGRQISALLNDLDDVTITSPSVGDVLTYNAGSWEASPSAGGGGSVDAPAERLVIGAAGGAATVSLASGSSGLTDGIRYGQEFFPDPTSTTAGSFVVGRRYQISTVGTTNFTACGAANNAVGTKFTATNPGSGTGTAVRAEISAPVFLTVTVSGGAAVSAVVTHPGTNYFVGDVLTDFNGMGGASPVRFNVDTVTAGTTTSSAAVYSKDQGTFFINYDVDKDEVATASLKTGAGRPGSVLINGISAQVGENSSNGGFVSISGGQADYFEDVAGGGVSVNTGYVYRPNITRNGTYIDMAGAGKTSSPSFTVNGGDIVVLLNSIRTLTNLVGGTGYTPGQYTEVQLQNGSGQGSSFNIVVNGSGVVTTVTVLNGGYGYLVGDTLLDTFNLLGAGTGFSVDVATVNTYNTTNGVAELDVFNGLAPGSGYTPGTRQVALLGGTGAGANATVVVNDAGQVEHVILGDPGSGYTVGDTLSTDFILGPGTGFTIDVLSVISETEAVNTGSVFIGGGTLLLNGGLPADITGTKSFGDVTIAGGYAPDGIDYAATTGGAVILQTDNVDRLKIQRAGPWEVNGTVGEPGQVLTTLGAGDSPEWQWTDAFFRLESTVDGTFDGTLFSTWDDVTTGEEFSSFVAFEDSTLANGDIVIPQSGKYEVRVEVIANPTTPSDWPAGESVYGTELTFILNDPTLVWQRKVHSRYVTPPGPDGLDGTQMWTDVYHVNVYSQLNDYGNGVPITALSAGQEYRIASVGTSDFTTVGAATNTVGTIFTATGAGTGTGVADGGNFLMRVHTHAQSTGGTESVKFSARVAVRFMGPGAAPA